MCVLNTQEYSENAGTLLIRHGKGPATRTEVLVVPIPCSSERPTLLCDSLTCQWHVHSQVGAMCLTLSGCNRWSPAVEGVTPCDQDGHMTVNGSQHVALTPYVRPYAVLASDAWMHPPVQINNTVQQLAWQYTRNTTIHECQRLAERWVSSCHAIPPCSGHCLCHCRCVGMRTLIHPADLVDWYC